MNKGLATTAFVAGVVSYGLYKGYRIKTTAQGGIEIIGSEHMEHEKNLAKIKADSSYLSSYATIIKTLAGSIAGIYAVSKRGAKKEPKEKKIIA